MTFLFTTQCFPHIDFPWGGHPGIKTAAQVYLIILAFSNVSFFYFIHPRNTIQALMLDISGRNYLKTAGQLQLAPIFKIKAEDFCVWHSHSLKQIQAFIVFGNACLFEFETKTPVCNNPQINRLIGDR